MSVHVGEEICILLISVGENSNKNKLLLFIRKKERKKRDEAA